MAPHTCEFLAPKPELALRLIPAQLTFRLRSRICVVLPDVAVSISVYEPAGVPTGGGGGGGGGGDDIAEPPPQPLTKIIPSTAAASAAREYARRRDPARFALIPRISKSSAAKTKRSKSCGGRKRGAF